MSRPSRLDALVLLGPTASGKTPLGQWLELDGLCGRPCVHFDFGDQLRQIVARDCPDRIASRAEIAFLRGVLLHGDLLEDEHFPLARRILQAFLAQQSLSPQTQVVLNGLPRHAGQARALTSVVNVTAIVMLECSLEVVLARIVANTGGDRTHRTDDDALSVRRKLAIFRQRTEPLCQHYETQGARIVRLTVEADSTTESLYQALSQIYRRSGA